LACRVTRSNASASARQRRHDRRPALAAPPGRLRRLALITATAAWHLVRRPPRPLVDPLGFPARGHPESLDRELPGPDEEQLAVLAAALWPADEYVLIVRAYLPGPGRGGTP
jgi:hypothetical protein